MQYWLAQVPFCDKQMTDIKLDYANIVLMEQIFNIVSQLCYFTNLMVNENFITLYFLHIVSWRRSDLYSL